MPSTSFLESKPCLLTCLALGSGSIAHTHLQFPPSSDPSAAKPNAKKMIGGERLTLKETQGMLVHSRHKGGHNFLELSLFSHSVHATETCHSFHSDLTPFHD